MKNEIKALVLNKTWDIVETTPMSNPLDVNWYLKSTFNILKDSETLIAQKGKKNLEVHFWTEYKIYTTHQILEGF